MQHRVGHPGRRVACRRRCDISPGREPGLLDSSRRPVCSAGSPATSRIPAGISMIVGFERRPVLPDEHHRRRCPRHRTPAARRRPRRASARCRGGTARRRAPRSRPTTTCQMWPWWTSAVAEVPEPVRPRLVSRRRHATSRRASAASAASAASSSMRRRPGGVASAASQRGADELAEQRVRPVGAALELGVGLRADPERVVGRAR